MYKKNLKNKIKKVSMFGIFSDSLFYQKSPVHKVPDPTVRDTKADK